MPVVASMLLNLRLQQTSGMFVYPVLVAVKGCALLHELHSSVSNCCTSIMHSGCKSSSRCFADHKELRLTAFFCTRSLTMHCCALLPEFASLNQLEYLGITGPYYNLRDLLATLALTWLRAASGCL